MDAVRLGSGPVLEQKLPVSTAALTIAGPAAKKAARGRSHSAPSVMSTQAARAQ